MRTRLPLWQAAIAVLQLVQSGADALKWLFPTRGPRRQILVAGVQVNATLHDL